MTDEFVGFALTAAVVLLWNIGSELLKIRRLLERRDRQ